MFGGDEVGALVMDIGSTNTRCGFAGEDTPKAFFPTAIGSLDDLETKSTRHFVGADTEYFRAGMEVKKPVENGIVTDWDAIERIWQHAVRKRLNVNIEFPLMVSEPSFNPTSVRLKHLELLFEKFDTPACFFCKDAVLSAFAAGRSTALVLDLGGGKTSCVAVHDGYVLNRGLRHTKLAGEVMDQIWADKLFGPDGVLAGETPQASFEYKRTYVAGNPPAELPSDVIRNIPTEGGYFQIRRVDMQGVTPSYHRFMTRNVLLDIKSRPFVQIPKTAQLDVTARLPSFLYELPDGRTLDIGLERFTVPEQMFHPTTEIKDDFQPFDGLTNMVSSCVDSCEVDIKKELYGNIILTGAHSLYSGLSHRLQSSLETPSGVRVKVLNQVRHERMFGPWIGGSILASLGTFHQMWFSRAEYEEHGPNILARKCP